MDFKDEYQNEMRRLSPSEEQLERIKNGVERRLAEPTPEPKKKTPFPIIAAVSGASVCAAAVLMFVFIGVVDSRDITMNKSEFFSNGEADHFAGGFDIATTGGSALNDAADNSTIQGNFGTDGAVVSESPSLNTTAGSMKGVDPTSCLSSIEAVSTASDFSVGFESSIKNNDSELFLSFSEDESQCTVSLDTKEQTYLYGYTNDYVIPNEIADHGETTYSGESLISAHSNLDVELFVRFDENYMEVFSENGKFYKLYKLI